MSHNRCSTTTASEASSAEKSVRSTHSNQTDDQCNHGTGSDGRGNGLADLEKANTIHESNNNDGNGAGTALSSGRISRIQSVTRRNSRGAIFNHALSHVRTTGDVVVDFDGLDDPYRPVNWPFRKKVITTTLYGFTTMGSTFASSVYSPAMGPISQQYHVGSEVSLLGLSFILAVSDTIPDTMLE